MQNTCELQVSVLLIHYQNQKGCWILGISTKFMPVLLFLSRDNPNIFCVTLNGYLSRALFKLALTGGLFINKQYHPLHLRFSVAKLNWNWYLCLFVWDEGRFSYPVALALTLSSLFWLVNRTVARCYADFANEETSWLMVMLIVKTSWTLEIKQCYEMNWHLAYSAYCQMLLILFPPSFLPSIHSPWLCIVDEFQQEGCQPLSL